jgi:hypothetical protein
MARGRFITNDIVRDKRVNSISDDTSRLAFTWLITFADKEGRVYGDPALLRSMLFPRRDDITAEDMEANILEWHSIGLVVWYEAEGDLWIHFPNFKKNQIGLRKDREPDSQIPHPESGTMPELVRIVSGNSPEDIPHEGGLIKVNVIKEEVKGIKEGESKNDSPPSKKPPPKTKKGKKRDPLLDHPAIIAYKDEARLHVPIAWREEVCETVDDAERWKELVHEWIGHGWNKQNISGMLEAYTNGGIGDRRKEPAPKGMPGVFVGSDDE